MSDQKLFIIAVTLWKLAALNPCISPRERDTLKQRLSQYHTTVIEKVTILITFKCVSVTIFMDLDQTFQKNWICMLHHFDKVQDPVLDPT
jgi:hypothetical protein